jgi:arsenite methyltransferase
MNTDKIRNAVKEKYGKAALRVITGKGGLAEAGSCCSPDLDPFKLDPITSNLYTDPETDGLPADALAASLGCGNPTALAELRPGDVVLDLGSGGGIDVLLSAKRVGPTGKAYGLDMTDEMLALARENQRRAGATNVEFLKGEIERIPLPDQSVDVIISNCVINLSGDKPRVIREAFRVLRPGGRLAISDIVVRGHVPPEIKKSMELWAGCVAGALEEETYRSLLEQAGFQQISIESTRIYGAKDAEEFLSGCGMDIEQIAREVGGKFVSAFLRAVKPASR